MGAVRTFVARQLYRLGGFVSGGKMFPGSGGRPDTIIPTLNADQKDLLSQIDHTKILNASRHIYNSFPMLVGAIDDKANAVVGTGWGPEFDGSDLEWGTAAEEWLRAHYEICDVRGHPFTMRESIRVGSITLDRDGEYFEHYVTTPQGYPKKQILESHRIGNRYHNTSYSGAQVRNGIAYNAFGRAVAYHFLGETKDADRWIDARHIKHVYDPKWFSQGRGVSRLVFGILDWLDVAATRDKEKVAQLMFSSLALKHKNASGQPDLTTQFFGQILEDGTVVTKEGADGQTMKELVEFYGSGDKQWLKIDEELEAFQSDRPTLNQRAFEEAVLRGAFAGLGWSYEQSYDASKLGGASVRRDIAKCQRSADQRAMTLAFPWLRYTGFAIASAMTRGLLPFSEEWYKFIPQFPARMTADPGNESKIELEEMRVGGRSLRQFSANRGRHWRDLRFDRETEGDDLMTRAERLHKKHPDFSLQFCADLISMMKPNGNQEPTDSATGANTETKEDAAA